MNDYVGALVDLDKTNELVANDSFTLKVRGHFEQDNDE